MKCFKRGNLKEGDEAKEDEDTDEEREVSDEQEQKGKEKARVGVKRRPLVRHQSIHQFLTSMVDVPKLVSLLESFPCSVCHQSVQVTAVQNQHGYVLLTLECHHPTCGWKKEWGGSIEREEGKGGMKQKEIPSRLARAMMLCGVTYNTYQLVTTLAEVGFMSKTAWEKGEEEQERIIQYLWEASSKRAIEAVKQRTTPLNVIFDARWSTARFRGAEGSIACIDAVSGSVLYVEHLMKRGRKKNHDGTSKSMEGVGVKKILKKMKADGLVLDGVIHDDNASTIKHTWAIYGLHVKEHLDINHQVKSNRRDTLY